MADEQRFAELLAPAGWAYASTPPVEAGDPGRFHALFGRDSLIFALQVLAARPDIARATLRALADADAQAVAFAGLLWAPDRPKVLPGMSSGARTVERTMTSARWQDLYQANQDTIRRSLADAGGAPTTVRGGSRASPRPSTPPTAARRSGSARRQVYTGPEGSRSYRVHLPPGSTGAVPLVLMLHGCTQDADAIAAGTRINPLADTEGFAVVYPEQSAAANRNGCWNWFLPEDQSRGAGEPAILAGIAKDLLAGAAGVSVDPARVFVAGMSAGAGMAAVLAATYPDLIAGVGLHSGLAYRAADSVTSAFAVMRRGAADPLASACAAHAGMGRHARVVPAVIVHGSADRTVAPINGEQAVRQWLETNRLASGSFRPDPDRPNRQYTGRVAGGYAYRVLGWDDGQRPVVEHWQVEGLGHGWSGGSPAGSFTDPLGPDATAAMWRFFAAAAPGKD